MSFIALALVLLGGTALRWVGLDNRPLEESELLHLAVARSLNDGAGPLLPSGNVYARGLETSRMIAYGLNVLDSPELAVRAPAAFASTLTLLLFALVVWRIAGAWAAVAATLLLALYPEALRLGRMGRFYSLQLLFGIAALYAGWRVVALPAATRERREVLRRWAWAMAAIAAMAAAAAIQVVTYSVAVGLAVALAIAALRDVHREAAAAIRTSVPLQLVLLGGVLAAAVLLLAPDVGLTLYHQARSVPFWARQTGLGPLHYVYALGVSVPLVASLAPLAFVVLLLRRPWLGVYLLTWFAVPLVLHSLLLPFRQERFILLAMPAAFAALGIVATLTGAALHRELNGVLLRSVRNPGHRDRLATALVALVALAVAGPMAGSALATVAADARSSRHPDWNSVRQIIAQDAALQALPLGGGHPLPALHHLGRVSFSVRAGFLERPAGHEALMRTGSAFRWEADGVTEYYAGTPVLTVPEAIRVHFAHAPGVLIVLEEREFTGGQTTRSLRQRLMTEGRELCAGRCGSLRLFQWQWQP